MPFPAQGPMRPGQSSRCTRPVPERSLLFINGWSKVPPCCYPDAQQHRPRSPGLFIAHRGASAGRNRASTITVCHQRRRSIGSGTWRDLVPRGPHGPAACVFSRIGGHPVFDLALDLTSWLLFPQHRVRVEGNVGRAFDEAAGRTHLGAGCLTGLLRRSTASATCDDT